MFALEYFRFNRDGVIKSEDAAYILAFAIMMLHTSLFNRSVKNRTTKKQWVSMNRGDECVCVCVCVGGGGGGGGLVPMLLLIHFSSTHSHIHTYYPFRL